MRYAIFIIAALSAVSCSYATGPAPLEYPGAVRQPIDATLKSLWSKTEGCSGYRAAITKVEFYVLPGLLTSPSGTNRFALGQYYPTTRRIYIAGDVWPNQGILMHEMLHAILAANFIRNLDHPSKHFGPTAKCSLQGMNYV